MNYQNLKKYRWPQQVEKTADKLNSLLAAAPDTVTRPPEINSLLIDRLIAITGYKPQESSGRINIKYTNQRKNQRDWMREIAVDTRWDQEKSVLEYARLDDAGKTPRKNRTQDSLSYARALWNDGLQKGWLRSMDHPSVKEDVEEILTFLNDRKIKATYNAVAAAIGIHHTQFVKLFQLLGARRPRASWVVNKDTLEPSRYLEGQKHPDLNTAKYVITDGPELRRMLGW